VVWHHCPGPEFIELPFAFPAANGLGNQTDPAGILQPAWSGGVTVQSTVFGQKGVARGGAANFECRAAEGVIPKAAGSGRGRPHPAESEAIFCGIQAHSMGRRNRLPHPGIL